MTFITTTNTDNYLPLANLSRDVIKHILSFCSPSTQNALYSISKFFEQLEKYFIRTVSFSTMIPLEPPIALLQDYFTHHPSLTALKVQGISFEDHHFINFKHLTALTELNLNTVKLTNEKFSEISHLIQLRAVTVINCDSITDYSPLLDLPNIQSLNLSKAKIDGATLSYLCKVPYHQDKGIRLTALDLSWCSQFSDSNLHPISTLTRLRTLNVSHIPNLTTISHLSELNQLTTLDVSYTAFKTNELEQLPQLTALNLENTVDKAQNILNNLNFLNKMTNLQFLNIAKNLLGSENLSFLGSAGQLRSLDLGYNYLKGSLTHLSNLTQLTAIHLEHNQLSDQDLSILTIMTKLRSVQLGYNRLTRQGISYLSSLPKLTAIDLSATRISSKDVIACLTFSGSKLNSLHINHIKIDDMSKLLHCFNNLRALSINRSNVQDGDLFYLSQHPPIQYLELTHHQITDRGLAYLQHMPNLNPIHTTLTS